MHTQRLIEVFDRLNRAGLKLKRSSCALLQKQICYLGRAVSNEEIASDLEKINAVKTGLFWLVLMNSKRSLELYFWITIDSM